MLRQTNILLIAVLLTGLINCGSNERFTDPHTELIALAAIVAEGHETYSMFRVHNASGIDSEYKLFIGDDCVGSPIVSIPLTRYGSTSNYFAEDFWTISAVQRVNFHGSTCIALDPPLELGSFRSLYDSGAGIRVL